MRLLPTARQKASAHSGFTLIELMIYVSLTAIIIGLFGGILIITSRIQGEQNSSVQVTQELNFLMNSMKRYVHESVSYAVISATELQGYTSTGVIRTIEYDAAGDFIELTEDDGIGQPEVSRLSSTKVRIDDLTFTDFRQGSSTAVQISITASANTSNPLNAVTRTLQSTAATLLQEL